jgi:DNA-binding NarL/FixJ family response regulator
MSHEDKGTFQHVRILLAGMSNMLSSIITAALAQAPDLVVVGQIGDEEDLTTQISLTNADAVITQSGRPGAIERFVPLLRRFPELKVVAIHGASNKGFVHQLRPCSTRLSELSADVLQAVLSAPFAPVRRVRR